MTTTRTANVGRRAFRLRRLLFAMSPFILACGAQDAGPITEEVVELPPVVETRWTPQTELFVEYPPLVEGEVSRFAIHFTDLVTFQPVRAGRATVRLIGAADTEFTVRIARPTGHLRRRRCPSTCRAVRTGTRAGCSRADRPP